MVDNAAVNTGVQMSFCISVLVFLRQKPRGGVELSEASQKRQIPAALVHAQSVKKQ